MGGVDPIRDAEVIMTELVLADAESVASQLQKPSRRRVATTRTPKPTLPYSSALSLTWTKEKPANLLEMDEDERTLAEDLFST